MPAKSNSRRPNLLFLWTDEQRADTMAAYGNQFVQAPNLNRLASTSFVFENAYCCQPVCTPSRASILSGHYPHRHGCVTNNLALPTDSLTIAERLPEEYRTAYFGKWHLGDEVVPQRGFTDWLSLEDAIYRKYYSKEEYLELRSDYHHYLWANGFPPDQEINGARLYSRGKTAVMGERHTKAAFLGRETARWIRERAGEDQPWMMSACFLEPHMPFQSPLNHLHDPEEMPVGSAFNQPPGPDQAKWKQETAAKYRESGFENRPLKSDWDWRRLRANYYGLVTLVDRAVGDILEALRESGQADNTIVVFTSDHGEMMGDHACLTKSLQYEESIRIPLLMRVPWLSRNEVRIPGRVSQIDLLPTLMELMDVERPGDLDGQSRAAVLEAGGSLEENEVVVEWNCGREEHERRAAATGTPLRLSGGQDDWRTLLAPGGWKLSLSTGGETELFNLQTDPAELENLAGKPEHQGRVQELTARLRGWQEEHADPCVLSGD